MLLMDCIRPLSEAVQSTVRSGFIIGSLTTVVEELIYNSLDAGATKVSVLVGVNNGYIKVEDDGYGISRDGLVLLGERYATSKDHNLHKKADSAGSYGFRGEVLCSIADISLIEIVTRIHGRPNGYRKVMKGRKCLYLSIDDRQDVGTTVIVRDLFYNQPVRRRQLQCSAKKVLHSVRNCAVRIALVQPKVSFKVVDMESHDELLCAHASLSPLPILCSNFGIEASSLHELSFSKGLLKLTGYVSASSRSFSSKAVQYIYVNSRFVVKGPIHKALNRLADMCWDHLKGDKGGKRGQPHAGPSYCLNITCPRSFYDLSLESSETSVEFKDWAPVLTLIEKLVTPLWSTRIKNKESSNLNCEADQLGKDGIEKVVANMSSVQKDWWLRPCEITAKRRRTQNAEKGQASPDCMAMQVEGSSDLSIPQRLSEQQRIIQSKPVKVTEPEIESDSPYQMDFYGTGDVSPSNSIFSVKDSTSSGLWEADKGLVLLDESVLEKGIDNVNRDDSNADDYFFGSARKDKVRVGDQNTESIGVGDRWRLKCQQDNDRNEADDDLRKLQLQSHSWENLLESPLKCDTMSRYHIDKFNVKRSCSNFIDNRDVDGISQNIDAFQTVQGQSEVPNCWPLRKCNTGSHFTKDLDMNSKNYSDSLPSGKGSFARECSPEFLPAQVRVFSSLCFSANSGQRSPMPDPLLSGKFWDDEHLVQDEGLQKMSMTRSCDGYDLFDGEKEELYHDGFDDRFMDKNVPSTSILFLESDYAGIEKDIWGFSHGGCSNDDVSSVGPFFQKSYSSGTDKRQRDLSVSWSPSISVTEGVQVNLQALGDDLIPSTLRMNHHRCTPDHVRSGRCNDLLASERISPILDPDSRTKAYEPSYHCVSSMVVGKDSKFDLPTYKPAELSHNSSEQFGRSSLRSTRSHSAPPTYRGKRRFLSVSDCLVSAVENPHLQTAPPVCTVLGRAALEHPRDAPSFHSGHLQHDDRSSVEDSAFCSEQKVKGTSNTTQVSTWSEDDNTQAAFFSTGYLKEAQDLGNSRVKWREGCTDTTVEDIINYRSIGDRLNEFENTILDIQSCTLHLAGDSLVPRSINRNCLERAKVLLQVDNKFIPVVGSGTLAVIDQHAADERIRLEEMRQKVLSGELKSTTYLEEEKDLVLPELAYQLLCNYAEHIQHWGWICNIFSQDSGTFAKNLNLLNEQASSLRLLAVPSILGVNLSDADLLEFLEQLADTDGSSTIPPSVIRVLNYKACRGAIMFGDKLLPSECSLIVEELKRTSLCFQCAHGRPTTVPLVDLKALHKRITQLGSLHEDSKNTWHGLCRKKINIGRAKYRLDVARGAG